MRKIYRDGELIEVSDDYVLKDGERINVGSFFMDAALADANLNDARRAYVDRLTRKDDDDAEVEDERPALVWHVVNPMLKDSHTPAARHAVSVHDEGDAHAAYVARLTGRTMQDKAPDDAQAEYAARLSRHAVKDSPDDARASYIARMTRR